MCETETVHVGLPKFIDKGDLFQYKYNVSDLVLGSYLDDSFVVSHKDVSIINNSNYFTINPRVIVLDLIELYRNKTHCDTLLKLFVIELNRVLYYSIPDQENKYSIHEEFVKIC